MRFGPLLNDAARSPEGGVQMARDTSSVFEAKAGVKALQCQLRVESVGFCEIVWLMPSTLMQVAY